LQRFFVEGLYGTLAANARPTTASYNIDRQGLLQASLLQGCWSERTCKLVGGDALFSAACV